MRRAPPATAATPRSKPQLATCRLSPRAFWGRVRCSGRRLLLPRQEQGEQDEREHPGKVEVEPVREAELDREQHRGRERGELERALLPWDDGDDPCERDRGHLDDGLERGEVRDPACVVPPPAPDRERRRPVELEAEGPIPEGLDRIAQRRVEEQDRERGQRGKREGQ